MNNFGFVYKLKLINYKYKNTNIFVLLRDLISYIIELFLIMLMTSDYEV